MTHNRIANYSRNLIWMYSYWVVICLKFISFFSFIFISWRLITLQYCSGFCHTLTWEIHLLKKLQQRYLEKKLRELEPLFPLVQPFLFSYYWFIYIFILAALGSSLPPGLFSSCGEQELLSSWSAWASHCSGFSCCWAWTVALMGLSSCSSPAH